MGHPHAPASRAMKNTATRPARRKMRDILTGAGVDPSSIRSLLKRTASVIPGSLRRLLMRGDKSEDGAAVTDLPNDLIVEILACAAASSTRDLSSLKMSCKVFKELSEEGYVYRHASLENIGVLPRDYESIVFFDRCIRNRNPEALFRQGLVEFFKSKTVDAGSKYLRAAVEGGHYGASYLLGVMSVISGKKERVEQGFQLLNRVRVTGKVVECREMLTEAKHQFIWRSRAGDWFMAVGKHTLCPKQHWKKSGWSYDYEHFEDDTCGACKCDVEISYFCGQFCKES